MWQMGACEKQQQGMCSTISCSTVALAHQQRGHHPLGLIVLMAPAAACLLVGGSWLHCICGWQLCCTVLRPLVAVVMSAALAAACAEITVEICWI